MGVIDKSDAAIRRRWEANRRKLLASDKKLHKRIAAAGRVIRRHTFRQKFGIDWAWGSPNITMLKKGKVEFACRYLSKDPKKNLTFAQAKALANAGIDSVVVWETTANRALQGERAGIDDAKNALFQAKQCGMPEGRPIYFAVDFDVTEGQQAAVNDYFRGVNSIVGTARTGAYGGYWAIKRLFDARLITYGWQTYAWSGGNRDRRIHIYQYSNGHTMANVSCDYNRSYKADFGQWRPA